MKSQKKDRLREMQLAFIGKLMSGLSHDFKNHLAIIKELNGLIEDVLLLDETRQPADIERYKKIINGINERIAQAAEMCRVLSGFSHRMDQPLSSLSVTDVLQEKIYLLRRFAQQKQVEVISSFAEGLPVIYNNPSLLQFSIFCILWPLLELMEPDGRILITVGQRDESIEIVIKCEGTMKRPEEETPWEEMLPEVVHMLGADISRGTDQTGNENMVLIISSI